MKEITFEMLNNVAAGVWEGTDGGGCIPSPFPKTLPQLPYSNEL